MSFPNAGEIDREAYMRVLMEDVADSQPSIGDLEAACGNMRRRLKLRPCLFTKVGYCGLLPLPLDYFVGTIRT